MKISSQKLFGDTATIRRFLGVVSMVALSVTVLSGCSSFQNMFSDAQTVPSPLEEARASYRGERALQSAPHPVRTMLPSPVLELTPEVRRELSSLLRSQHGFVERSLERGGALRPLIEEILRDEGIPSELMNVAFLESRFDTDARSPAGAVGLWQFMRSTAKVYGLRVSGREDQRRDPILSTIAAARHLRDLYLSYKDWPLALAAYNAGSGTIDRALLRMRASDFWTLARNRSRSRLRIETVRYVPRFIAITYAIKNHEQYGPERALVLNREAAGLG